mgnify:FL=1
MEQSLKFGKLTKVPDRLRNWKNSLLDVVRLDPFLGDAPFLVEATPNSSFLEAHLLLGLGYLSKTRIRFSRNFACESASL